MAQAQTFPDVSPDSWYYTYVEQLVVDEVVNGSMDLYRPADNVNRAEMTKLVDEAFDITLVDPDTATFKDVAKDAWYYTYVETAAANGVVGGYKDGDGTLTGYFGPGDDVTREQAAKMIVLGAPMATNTVCGPTFTDVPVSSWAYSYVETLYANSVIDGYTDGSFGP
ncbi:S-layer homology domain-containing protein, partial [Patescibacteria group bacterium]|nr:S-layer homology domain-containing protein [Patescibacteria group bacterium]